ncbi:MAG TPA: chorismate synthase [Peptococcaceae bacterium]|nr:chorismate synthase [Peptococcaceae bacterium]
MSGSWGNNLKIAIFGESHGPAIGITMSGLPSGLALDMEMVNREMQRRAPGQNDLSTPRKEADVPQILSGIYQGKTTGTPLCAIIENQSTRASDYEALKDLMRPGHGDYPGTVRYQGFQDPRGGGHFSGRITAPLVFAGAVCKQILAERGIRVGAHIQSIGTIKDLSFELEPTAETLEALAASDLPLLDPDRGPAMAQAVLHAKTDCDSLGGTIECVVIGVEPGIGEPFFDSVESTLSHLLFSIPGIKGVEFGAGFASAAGTGSQCNDLYYYEGTRVKTHTNRCGGVTGGITNGMPILFRVAVRPTASISKPQETIALSGGSRTLTITGRHDPCIVPRAVPVVEAAAAIGILDLLKEREACRI